MRKFLFIGIETGTDYREAVICEANNEREASNKAYKYFNSLKWELGIQKIISSEISNDNIRTIK